MDWNRPHPRADGLSITLYEKKLNSSEHHGDPIADTYAIVVRPNSCIMSLADGINWGVKPRLAARAAVAGCVTHLHEKLFDPSVVSMTTQDIFHHLLLSFDEAHKTIIKHGGTTTTLTVAMICELQSNPRVTGRWGLCVVSVGDSPCYLYQPDLHKVYEVTAGAHMGKGRDPRDAGGCLGANIGDDPDLANLICCFLPVCDNDIVFLTSDGISDNFDPVILKQATPASHPTSSYTVSSSLTSLPSLSPEERHQMSMSLMAKIIHEKQEGLHRSLSIQDVIDAFITYTVEVTDQKRRFLEDVWKQTSDPQLSPSTRREKERRLSQKSKSLPGKLDHSTIVGYQVGTLVAESGLVDMPPQKTSQCTSDLPSLQPLTRPTFIGRNSQFYRNNSVMDTKLYQGHRF